RPGPTPGGLYPVPLLGKATPAHAGLAPDLGRHCIFGCCRTVVRLGRSRYQGPVAQGLLLEPQPQTGVVADRKPSPPARLLPDRPSRRLGPVVMLWSACRLERSASPAQRQRARAVSGALSAVLDRHLLRVFQRRKDKAAELCAASLPCR